jgi:hypothetical protein
MEARLDRGWWLIAIPNSNCPCGAVKWAVPGIIPNDYYWTRRGDGIIVGFRRLKDAEAFVKKGGPALGVFTRQFEATAHRSECDPCA